MDWKLAFLEPYNWVEMEDTYDSKVLLMPSFSDVDPAIENQAEAVYRSVLPSDWSIKRINCDKLVLHHGQLHCISYNIPAFVDIDNLLSHAIPQIQGENED